MGRKGRHIDKVSRPSLVYKLQVLSPAEAGASTHDIDDGFQFSMMVRTGFRVWMHDDRPRPKLLRAYPGVGNGLGAGHAGGLRRIAVEFPTAHNAQAEGCWRVRH